MGELRRHGADRLSGDWTADDAAHMRDVICAVVGGDLRRLPEYLRNNTESSWVSNARIAKLVRLVHNWTSDNRPSAPLANNARMLAALLNVSLDHLLNNAIENPLPSSFCWYIAAIEYEYLERNMPSDYRNSTIGVKEEVKLGQGVAKATRIISASDMWRSLHRYTKQLVNVTLEKAIGDVLEWVKKTDNGTACADQAREIWYRACFRAALTVTEGARGTFPAIPILIETPLDNHAAGFYYLTTAYDQIADTRHFREQDKLYYIIQYLLVPVSG